MVLFCECVQSVPNIQFLFEFMTVLVFLCIGVRGCECVCV